MIQFNPELNWHKIYPHLNSSEFREALSVGMKKLNENYQDGDPPYELGRGPLNGQVVGDHDFSWYQPWGRCHHIAPFAMAIGKKIYPYLRWEFLTSDAHTVVTGSMLDVYKSVKIQTVIDYNFFKDHTAEGSIDLVKRDPNWYECSTVEELFRS